MTSAVSARKDLFALAILGAFAGLTLAWASGSMTGPARQPCRCRTMAEIW